jgi:hypothetical protein
MSKLISKKRTDRLRDIDEMMRDIKLTKIIDNDRQIDRQNRHLDR